MIRLPRVRPGDPIAADDYNAMIDAARRCGVWVAANGYFTADEHPAGTNIGFTRQTWRLIRLTSHTGNKFAWTEVIEQAGGTFADGYSSGTVSDDYAAEVNGNDAAVAAALPTIVRSWREAGKVLFQAGSC